MKKQHPFNMIEILLALGVVAIGICSVMVLFPVGANAGRDASMETYAADLAEQTLHLAKFNLNKLGKTNWATYIESDSDYLPGTVSAPSDYNSDLDSSSDWSSISSSSNPIFAGVGSSLDDFLYQNSNDKNVFQLIVHRNQPSSHLGDSTFSEKIDFRAIMELSKEKIKLENAGVTQDIDYKYGVQLVATISWPAELPRASRQKATYRLTVFKDEKQ